MEKTDNLKKFGIDFQQKCISALVSDKAFIERITDIIDYNFFETDALQWVCRETISYFIEYKTVPTLTVFKVKIDAVTNEVLKASYVDCLRHVYQKVESNDLTFVKEQFLDFCKNQMLKKAILDSVEHLNTGEYEKIKQVVDSALKAGMERNVGHIYDEDIEARMSVAARNCVPTGLEIIDDLLDGGLGGGELGIIAGSPGGGKSWLLCKLGTEAMLRGKSVLHITLELNEAYVGLRYDSIFTKIDFQEIRNHKELVKTTMDDIKGKLVIKYYPIKTIPALTIKNHVDRLNMMGKKIDLIVVDYADILRPLDSPKNSNSYQDAGSIYEELRAIAGELQVPIWSASQVSRSGAKEDVIEAQHMADSYRKVMTADVVISLSRKTEDKKIGTARFHVMKNRFGADGLTFPAKMNTSNGDIQLFSPESQEGIQMQNLMEASAEQEELEVKKKLLAKVREMETR